MMFFKFTARQQPAHPLYNTRHSLKEYRRTRKQLGADENPLLWVRISVGAACVLVLFIWIMVLTGN